MTGGSLSRSIEELEKLAIYVGESDSIREEDVKVVVVPSREWNVFKLCDAIVRDNAGEAMRQLRILVESPPTGRRSGIQKRSAAVVAPA